MPMTSFLLLQLWGLDRRDKEGSSHSFTRPYKDLAERILGYSNRFKLWLITFCTVHVHALYVALHTVRILLRAECLKEWGVVL